MAIITATAIVDVQRTKTIKIKVRVKDVKDWLRENYGTPSEHGYEWNEDHILQEYLEEVEPTAFDDLDGDIEDVTDGDWEFGTAESET
tara:strand:+ start:329 stop:592 length:264 start_codon:yes stop_codon:yes gene_type:complete